jgi:hypothetical protein
LQAWASVGGPPVDQFEATTSRTISHAHITGSNRNWGERSMAYQEGMAYPIKGYNNLMIHPQQPTIALIYLKQKRGRSYSRRTVKSSKSWRPRSESKQKRCHTNHTSTEFLVARRGAPSDGRDSSGTQWASTRCAPKVMVADQGRQHYRLPVDLPPVLAL